MSTKLTLSFDKKVIEKAKEYARSNGRSLSNIIEEYLKSLVQSNMNDDDFKISPAVKALWGSVKVPESLKGNDYKDMIGHELEKKYFK